MYENRAGWRNFPFSISHYSFSISIVLFRRILRMIFFRLPNGSTKSHETDESTRNGGLKWKMKNEKWKIENRVFWNR